MQKAFFAIFISILLILVVTGVFFAKKSSHAIGPIRQGFSPEINKGLRRKPKELMIKFKKRPRVQELIGVAQQPVGIVPRYALSGTNVMLYEGDVSEQTVQTLLANPDIDSVVPNREMHLLTIPNDPALLAVPPSGGAPLQWNLYSLKLAGTGTSAWDLSAGSGTVTVAVIDSGVDSAHPDLSGKIVELINCAGQPCQIVATMTDASGHGTHVAGLVAASTNNGVDIAGAGYNSRLVILKVVQPTGELTVSDVINAIRFAADRGVKVINLSVGAVPGNLDQYIINEIDSAVAYAWGKGIVVVAAAGNCGRPAGSHDPQGDACDVVDASGNFVRHEVNPKVYPAASANVLSVAALRINNTIASYSERNDGSNSSVGNWIAVAAPGGDTNSNCDTNVDGYNCILSTWPQATAGRLAFSAGTSIATPQVAGIAALMFAKNPSLSNAAVKGLIESTANASVARPQTNHGMVDALAALQAAGGNPSLTLGASPSPTQGITPSPTRPVSPSPTRPSSPTPTIPANSSLTPTQIPQSTLTPRVGGRGRPTDKPKLPKTPPNPYPKGPYCPDTD